MSARRKPEPSAEVESPADEVEVVMVRASRGAKPGDKRTVDTKRAADLVRAGLAKRTS